MLSFAGKCQSLARKIAMDEAVRRFDQIGHTKGIIACFDADSLCDDNYLIELEEHFINHSLITLQLNLNE